MPSALLINMIERMAKLEEKIDHFFSSQTAIRGEVDVLRHLLADADGNFQDLDVKVTDGVVTTGRRVAAITCGDIHHEQLNPTIAMTSWATTCGRAAWSPTPTS